MPKYEVTVTETRTVRMLVPATDENGAKRRAIGIASDPGALEPDVTIPEEIEQTYTGTVRRL
jgi:hypothetical protein